LRPLKEDAIISAIMAQVIIRNLDPNIVEALKARAKRHERSLEAELRETLTQSVVRDREDFLNWVDRHRIPGGPDVDVVALIHQGREERTRAIMEAIDGPDH
jgi:antitoxin FitA